MMCSDKSWVLFENTDGIMVVQKIGMLLANWWRVPYDKLTGV